MESNAFQLDTDIGAVWKREVEKFNLEHPECVISSPESWRLESMDSLAEQRRGAFGKWRKADPPESKRAWLKEKLKSMSGIAIKLIDGAGALASGAFAPAPAIAQVLTFLLTKTGDLSDHLDNIQDFFDITESLFLRLQLVERRMPREPGFVRQLERVFAKILQLLSLAVRFTKQNKFKLFLKELGEGNSDAKDAWTAIQTQIGQLDSTVMYATLGAVKEHRESSERIELGVRSVDSRVRLIQKDTVDISTKMQHISSTVRIIKDEVRHLNPKAASSERAKVADGILEDGGGRALESFKHLRAQLRTADVDALLDRRLAELSAAYLPPTCSWIEQEESFENLVADDADQGAVKSLIITGGANTGKSMMASYILAHLRRKFRDSADTAVAYFRFGEDFGQVHTAQGMMNSCIVQIADKSQDYRKWALSILQKSDVATSQEDVMLVGSVAAERAGKQTLDIKRRKLESVQQNRRRVERLERAEQHRQNSMSQVSQAHPDKIQGKWKLFFEGVFQDGGPGSTPRGLLFLILDGIDQLEENERDSVIRCLHSAMTVRHRIRLIITVSAMSEKLKVFEQSGPILDLSTKSREDLKIFTASLVKTSGRLGILRSDEQAKVVEAIHEKTTSFLHAAYLVRRINALGLVRPTEIVKCPFPSTSEDIYKDLLQRCAANRVSGEVAQLQYLFAWLTYCESGYMSTEAAKNIMGMVYTWPVLTSEDEICPSPLHVPQEMQGFASPERFEEEYESNLSRVLSISTSPVTRFEDDSNQTDQDVLSFRHAALRQYCRAASDGLQVAVIVPPNLRSVLMFTLFTHAIIGNSNKEATRYAVKHWIKTLHETEETYGTTRDKVYAGATAATVVDCIARVLKNENQALQRLEDGKDVDNPDETASIFGGNETEIDATLEVMDSWVGAVVNQQEKEAVMTDGAKEWLDMLRREWDFKVAILRETARRHMENWLAADHPYGAYASCRFAQRALYDESLLADDSVSASRPYRPKTNEDDSVNTFGNTMEETVHHFIQKYSPLTAEMHNAISMAYRYDGKHDQAIYHLRQGIEILEQGTSGTEGEDNDANLRFTLYSRLGRVYHGKVKDKADQGAENINKPLAPFEIDSKKGDTLIEALKSFERAVDARTKASTDRVRVFELKASVEALLGRHETCLKSLEQAVEVANDCDDYDGTFTTRHFEELVQLLMQHTTEESVAPSSNVMALVKMLGANQLTQTCRAETHRQIQEAAEKQYHIEQTRKDEKDCVSQLASFYEDAAKILLQDKDDYAMTLCLYQTDLALFMQKDRAKAKKVIATVLDGVASRDAKSITRVTWRLADILLEQFMESVDLKEKKTALDEMESLLRRMQELRPEFEAEQSQMSIPLYLMRRVLGPADDFFSGAYETFHGCFKALMDDIADNDVPSLQVLAKVLRLVPGLEEEATIVASSQFYVLDQDLATTNDELPSIVCTNTTCGRQLGKNDAAWLCCFCTNTLLCGACFEEAGQAQSTDRRWYPCRSGHQGIPLPAQQLKGIGKKKMVLVGDGDVLIVDWLKQLELKWNEAWKKYWNRDMV